MSVQAREPDNFLVTSYIVVLDLVLIISVVLIIINEPVNHILKAVDLVTT